MGGPDVASGVRESPSWFICARFFGATMALATSLHVFGSPDWRNAFRRPRTEDRWPRRVLGALWRAASLSVRLQVHITLRDAGRFRNPISREQTEISKGPTRDAGIL